MRNVIRNKNFYLMVLVDILLVAMSYVSSYLLRFEGHLPAQEWLNLKTTIPFVVLIKLLIFFPFNMYKGMWRFTSLVDLLNIIKAALVSTAVIVLAILYAYRFEGFPRSVFIIDLILTVALIAGVRIIIRLLLSPNIPWHLPFHLHHTIQEASKKILIIGAGSAGEKVIREILDNPGMGMDIAGLLDDDPANRGKLIHGYAVLGSTEELSQTTVPYDEVLIAIPSLNSAGMRRIVSLCEATGKKFRTMPSLGELIGGRLSVNAIREVTIEDVLGRGEVKLEEDRIHQTLHNKRILVTGAGGSIGSELVRQIARFHPQSVTLIDFSEYNLFQIEMEYRRKFAYIPMCALLADIRDKNTIKRIFQHVKPDVVFHAAAYKHVPIQERHPWEAVFNNVAGTRNLLEAALEATAERFILVSTDKAVRPTNIMGATKRVAEMLVESANGLQTTQLMAVRFGNVLSSSGSVVPIFQEQIARGGPVTVTHPDVTRYFMTIPEAAQLILQAASMGEGGETFILDMGEPVRIIDLAKDLIRLHGLVPEKDIPIQFTGLRPGEKLIEELITNEEGLVSTPHEKIMVLRGKANNHVAIQSEVLELLAIAKTCDTCAIKNKLQELVPEYIPEINVPDRHAEQINIKDAGTAKIYALIKNR